ncbi:MAG: sigma-70 family RNA polymerase sigma factor [Cyclobacteriaceae bacterium]
MPSKSDVDNEFARWFEKTYETNFERLYRYSYSITKDKQTAEDVVSEVFMGLWKKGSECLEIKNIGAYLQVSVRNLAVKKVSVKSNWFSYSDQDESLQVTDIINPENLLMGKELELLISQMTADLSPHRQLVFDMAKNKGYSHKRIAEELGVSQRTVEKHLQIVIKTLKDGLKKYLEKSDGTYRFISKIRLFLA